MTTEIMLEYLKNRPSNKIKVSQVTIDDSQIIFKAFVKIVQSIFTKFDILAKQNQRGNKVRTTHSSSNTNARSAFRPSLTFSPAFVAVTITTISTVISLTIVTRSCTSCMDLSSAREHGSFSQKRGIIIIIGNSPDTMPGWLFRSKLQEIGSKVACC